MSSQIYNLSKLFSFILILLISQNLYSQDKYNFETFSDDFQEIINQPSRWNSNDLTKFAAAGGITYGLMYFDEMIRKEVLKNQSYRHTIPIEFGRIWGEPWFTGLVGGSLYLQGLATDNNKNKKLGFEIGESALYTSIITLLLKVSFGRERPRENSDAFSYQPFSFKDNNFLSFSSGHTALAFSLSTVLAKNTDNKILSTAFFIPAFMTAFSRVYQNHHWFSDVFFGGIIGFTVAEFVTNLHKSKSEADDKLAPLEKPINLIDIKIPLY